MSRGRATIRDPAVAIAAAKCWLASEMVGGVVSIPTDSFHPSECTFCGFDRDGIMLALQEFVKWSGISSDEEEQPLRLEIEQWLTLPSSEQARLVQKAGGVPETRPVRDVRVPDQERPGAGPNEAVPPGVSDVPGRALPPL